MNARPPHATDRDLVAAHLGGDTAAFAAIYDRYADSLHDTAAAMLSNRHDAEDLTHDVFVIASAKLGQLRDPDRLRPWLFSILRHEVYRRSKQRARVRATDLTQGTTEMVAPTDPHADAADVEREELATFVREAAAGLAERDQLLLELSARQGLAGADLADAVGVSQQQCHVLLHRMRGRVQRSLGALAVARHGRQDCPDLQALLQHWDGTFDPRVRKRVATHVDGCDTCERTSRKFAVVPLMSAAPVLAAPPSLRTRVLESTRGSAGAPETPGATSTPAVAFGSDGFPTAAGTARPLALAAAVTMIVLLLAGAAWVVIAGDSGSSAGQAPGISPSGVSTTAQAAAAPPASDAGATGPPANGPVEAADPTTVAPTSSMSTTSTSTSTSSSTTTSTTVPPTTTPPATAVAPPTTPAPPPPPPPVPGTLGLSAGTLNLGSADRQATLRLANSGEEPLDWSIDGDATPFVWALRSGVLAPGGAVDVRVTIDRGPLAEGSYSRSLTVSSSALGTAPLTVIASVERVPSVAIRSAPSFLRCPSATGQVVVDVADESPVGSVVLAWSGAGPSGSVVMTPLRSGWQGELAPAPTNGDWTWVVRATDQRGNVGTVSAPFVLSGC